MSWRPGAHEYKLMQRLRGKRSSLLLNPCSFQSRDRCCAAHFCLLNGCLLLSAGPFTQRNVEAIARRKGATAHRPLRGVTGFRRPNRLAIVLLG